MMKTNILKAGVLLAAAVAILPSIATTSLKADVGAGEKLANEGVGNVAPCMSCHGEKGEGIAVSNFPRIAGASQYYISKQLKDFKAGKRKQAVMQPMAAELSEQQILDVSMYYSNLPTPEYPTPSAVDPKVYAQGEQLAERGDIERQLVSCANCHGPRGIGLPPAIPALIGQSSGYLAAQLTAWQKGDRMNDDGGLMAEVASNLSPEDIAAVAAYYSTVRASKSQP